MGKQNFTIHQILPLIILIVKVLIKIISLKMTFLRILGMVYLIVLQINLKIISHLVNQNFYENLIGLKLLEKQIFI